MVAEPLRWLAVSGVKSTVSWVPVPPVFAGVALTFVTEPSLPTARRGAEGGLTEPLPALFSACTVNV